MSQPKRLREAARALLERYKQCVEEFSIKDFLKAGVDPFRFSFNVAISGKKQAILKEIEHKLAMKLENMVGDFHENYLGKVKHLQTNSSWEKVPSGELPGIDIKNKKLDSYLQIKSKHNSMNSSSSKKLAQELEALKKKYPDAFVGCGWVIASNSVSCIGESEIAKVAETLKGKTLYSYVTGNEKEMDEVIRHFPKIIKKECKDIDFNDLFKKASSRILRALEERAKTAGVNIIEYLYNNAVG